MRESLSQTVQYARAHHAGTLWPALVVLAVTDAVFGTVQLTFPAAHVPLSYRGLIPVGLAFLAVRSLEGPGEQTASVGHRYARAQRLHLLLAVGLACLLVGSAELASIDSAAAAVGVRSVLVWSGLALLSGSLLGWSLCWVLPVASLFPLTYWEADATGGLRWWFWVGQPASYMPCWILASAALGLGLLARWLTPWRRRWLYTALRQRRTGATRHGVGWDQRPITTEARGRTSAPRPKDVFWS